MKTNSVLYLTSLVILAGAIYLVVEYPNSGRYSSLAGGLTMIGFALNIAGYALKKQKVVVIKRR